MQLALQGDPGRDISSVLEYTVVSIGKFKVVSSADSEEPAALVCKLGQYSLCQGLQREFPSYGTRDSRRRQWRRRGESASTNGCVFDAVAVVLWLDGG
ncbi:hypothetical protein E2562_020304 [Oryza meyeriana var. granulata]|uniref:Uncharacterized protein n=1 Tax=Oryza meyeriana var. granulata TaxID=110450 RepID=A0A6G1EAN6_9ORYZ|nr:hypothetical protein E2562_020304 [Oryza meyeriana var. granulata]